jgi:hypothetical protein
MEAAHPNLFAPPRPKASTPAPATPLPAAEAFGVEMSMTLPIRLYSTTNERDWKKKSRIAKTQRAEISAWFGSWASLLRRGLPLSIVITRIAPRKLDNDNLQSSAKHVRDGLAAVIGIDDADPAICWETVRQERGPYATRIEIRSRKETTR